MNVSVVDLFAGPGGLGEGFSAFSGKRSSYPFRIKLSVEKEVSAHKTLQLRAFYRQFRKNVPLEYYHYLEGKISREQLFSSYSVEAAQAIEETLGGPRALGDKADDKLIYKQLRNLCKENGHWVVIGGPPCQAYSLVGRARNSGIDGYAPENDHRHFLYEEYLRVLTTVEPQVFVMENVKGILSSKVNGKHIFPTILDDLGNPRRALKKRGGYKYKIYSLSHDDSEGKKGQVGAKYILRAEDYGIPQARHRVILLGVREDISIEPNRLTKSSLPQSTAESVLADCPPLRSGLSKGGDSPDAWLEAVEGAIAKISKIGIKSGIDVEPLISVAKKAKAHTSRGARFLPRKREFRGDEHAASWYLDEGLKGFVNHESRGHIVDDLTRYLFCAEYARQKGGSPRASEFPKALAPNHANWGSGKFVDRFKVQLAGKPSSTITSHISKDGHYFIHPDPAQCRSLTVREAARLQTFPDNYFFEGNRTQQYVQVGNAVPPLLANQIAKIVYQVLSV